MSLDARPGRPVPGCGWIAPLAELPVGAVYADGDIVAIRAADQVVRHAHPVRVLAWTPPDCPSCLNPLRFDPNGVETFSCQRCEMMWPADFFTTVDGFGELRLPSPVHHEDNPLCACIPAYLERDLTDPQCPLDVAVEAVEAATGLEEHRGVWGPPPAADELPGPSRLVQAILDGDRSARITFRVPEVVITAHDLWGLGDMPSPPTAADVAESAFQVGREEFVRSLGIAESITVIVAGPDAGEFTSTTI